MITVSPSILSANILNLKNEISRLIRNDVSLLHIDVMDGNFVPNITFGPIVVEAIKKEFPDLLLDVHLMISEPDRYLTSFINAGSDILTVHKEACVHLDRTLDEIKRQGARAGVALNPATTVEFTKLVSDKLDLVLVMSVNPGFGGQKFIPRVKNKIKELVKIREAEGASWKISVDGGINEETAPGVIDAGADILVAGSYIFNPERKVVDALKRLKMSQIKV